MNNKLLTETVKIEPRRVYKCKQDNRMASRQDVLKDSEGKYHCKRCGGLVEDVTNTETGQSFIQVLSL
jgi:predicted SprT family Zn-dependent metalloprotease